ncbi:hypothetical protein IPN35_04960 [Candidatus Peregrinibacteria bacterium]|nr:MAG: hypothetical protein IPN35_04960 [Candidatus Peregrinibacteria bacterium]
MTNFQIELAEPEKLFLVYYALFYHKKKDWKERLKRKYVFLDVGARACLEDKEIKQSLNDFYEEEILTSFYIWDYKIEKKEDKEENIDKLFFFGKEKPK